MRLETLHPLPAQCGQWAAQRVRYRLAGLRAKEVMLMSFKIRMKMFIAESRTCVSAESCGKGTALSQPFGFIFAHSLFICWWCCLTGPQSGLRLPGWDWKDIAAACVWTSLPRVSARTFLQLGGPVDMRAGGSVCVCPCARACAQPGVCWGGSLCVFFCVISWLLGDCLGVTLCVCVCS